MDKEKFNLLGKAKAAAKSAKGLLSKKKRPGEASKEQDQEQGTQRYERPKGAATTRAVPRVSEESLLKGRDTQPGVLFVPRTRPRYFALSVLFTSLWLGLLLVAVAGMAGVGALVGVARAYMETTPELDFARLGNETLSQTSYIYDANGDLITTFVDIENRDWVNIDEIPDMLKNAFIAIEDIRFMKHQGVDYKRLFSIGFKTLLLNQDDGGGSTITQQLIKNRILSNEVSYKRKIQEAYMALELEKTYTKDQILEAYLNVIHLGESNYGVKAAADDYFDKSLRTLTIRECAMLAGLTQNPYTYNPRKNMYQRDKFEITDKRTDRVLDKMYEAGFISKEQYDQALTEKVSIVEKSKVKQMYEMPYFVEYAIYDVVTAFLKKNTMADTKQNRSIIEKQLRSGGYRIYTTVDPAMQHTAEDILENWTKYPKMRYPADNTVRSELSDGQFIDVVQPQAAVVVIDYHAGEVKALVGGRERPKVMKGLNRAYQGAAVGAGSSIKPLAVYGPALDAGASPASIIYNMPGAIEGYGAGANGKGYPGNFGGEKNPGPVTIRTGIRSSLNIVAARVLYQWVTTPVAKDYLIKLGVDQSRINADGPGLALGTSVITPLEFAAAFGAIANNGLYLQPVSFTKVVDARGNVVLSADDPEIRAKRQVFKSSTCWMLTSMLTEAVQSGTGTNAKIKGMTVAGKTGTNSDSIGVGFTGYTPYYSASVLVGQDKHKPLKDGATGGAYAAPIWQAIMSKIHSDQGLEDKPIIDETPEELGLIKATVCAISGKKATPECSQDARGFKPVTDWFLSGTEPPDDCDMHVTQTVCSVSGKLATPYCPQEAIQQRSILVVPEESILRTIDPDVLARVFPHAFLDMPDTFTLQNLVPGTMEYEEYYCPIHTQFWEQQQSIYNPNQPQPGQSSSEYVALIERAQAFLSDPATNIDDYSRNRLSMLISDLERAISQYNSYDMEVRYVALRNALDFYMQ